MGELLVLESSTRNGGIFANKPGYHNTRANLIAQGLTNDYSIRDAVDKLGPSDKSAAYDWTFPEAQSGNYTKISKYGQRVKAAYNAKDPRLAGWREALGNIDTDGTAEGFDFRGWFQRTPDSSHAWHWHFSEDRAQVESYLNKRKMLSILKGDTLEDWELEMALEWFTQKDWDVLRWRVDALVHARDAIVGGPVKGEAAEVVKLIKDAASPDVPNLSVKLDEILLAAVNDGQTTVTMSPEDRAALVAELVSAVQVPTADEILDELKNRLES